MREIKFRAFIKFNKTMLNVANMDFKRKEVSLFNEIPKPNPCDRYSFDDVELMQYTGLKDKNGVEVYEGDIVMWGSEDGTIETCIGYGIVEYWDGDACFEIKDLIGVTNGLSCVLYNEVIGNIYENPELLEQ